MKLAYLLLLSLLIFGTSSQANGRQPCDRGAGGISHCSGGKFICNNGTVSRSKKVCAVGGDDEDFSTPAAKPKKPKAKGK